MKENIKTTIKKELDWVTMAIPFLIILLLCISFIFLPDSSKHIIESIRTFLGEELGTYYLAVGLGAFILSLFLAFSRYGKIRLGKGSEKPQYSNFAWGSMMFTSGLAADILFYSLCEWILYAQDPHMAEMGSIQQWSGTYPLFHWGPIPWSFYLILAVSFGFMLHVRGCHKQKFSEACRPLLGSRTDKAPGKIIDLIAVFALLAGTATTFSLATPLMSQIAADLLGIDNSKWITILILVITCIVYTFCVVRGMHGIMKLAASCVYLFFGLLAYVLIFGGETRYIIETGFSSEFCESFHLYRSAENHLLPAELDYFLLGVLDGMVCRRTIFYRQYFKGTHGKTNDSGRIYFWPWRHIYELYYPRQLQPWFTGVRQARRDWALYGNR